MVRSVLTLLTGAAAAAAAATDSCPFPGWDAHKLVVTQKSESPLVNASHPDMSRDFDYYGFEGGAAVKVDDSYYLVLTEFYAQPYWVPSRISVWATNSSSKSLETSQWSRLSTLFTSSGVLETEACTDPRGSLGSSASPIFNEELDVWELFYVGFYSCCPKDEEVHHFYNRHGRQYHARSQTKGKHGIAGPYKDLGVVMAPEDATAQPWEGLQGIDSMSPPHKGQDGKWYSFYGSANTEDHETQDTCLGGIPGKPGNSHQSVGLASSSKLEGPWTRLSKTPLIQDFGDVEQPIVTRLSDGTYAAVFDALPHQGKGQVGYVWSPDGVSWDLSCGQLLDVAGSWGPAARTPQGLIVEADGSLTLFFTAFDLKKAQGGPHESLGFARVAFQTVLV